MNADDDPFDSEEEDLVIQAATTAVIGAALAAADYFQTHYDKTPYHNSAFTGIAWVHELLKGHPKRIRKELGVHKHVFHALIASLHNAGYTSSRHVTLEEQLAIFLYTCVTGLSLTHVCERFQRAMDTTSKCVHSLLFITIIADLFVTDISSRCCSSFPPHCSTMTMSNYHRQMHPFHPRS